MLSSLLERQNFLFHDETNALSSAEAPAGYPYKIAIMGKKRKRAGGGKREKAGALFSLSPSHRAPRAVFFSLPSLLTTQRGP